MRRARGDMTAGDVGVQISITTDEELSGDVNFEFVKPDGSTITRDVTSLSGATALYVTAAGDIDQAGIWFAFLKDATTGFYYNDYGGNAFTVREKPADMGALR